MILNENFLALSKTNLTTLNVKAATMKKVLLGLAIALVSSVVVAKECVKIPDNVAKLVPSPTRGQTVEGELATFDPCHFTARLSKPFWAKKPPVVIMVHGGGGWGIFEENLASALVRNDIAVISFDAYRMNRLKEDKAVFAYSVTNEARQRMIYKVALGAVNWAISKKEEFSGIYIYGISNGGVVAINLAGAVSSKDVKAVFSEGSSSAGLGLPDKINVPLRLLVGALDNYGGHAENDLVFTRQTKCIFNVEFIQPPGNAKTCNATTNQFAESKSVSAWKDEQQAQGADIEVWTYKDSAHGVWAMPLTKTTRQFGELTLFAYTGGSYSDQEKMLKEIKSVINKEKSNGN